MRRFPAMATLRLLRPADIPLVDPLLKSSYGNPNSYAPRLRRLLSLEPGGWLLLETEGRPLGMGGVTIMGKTAYFGLVAVSPRAQRRGIATIVMKHLLGIAEGRGCLTFLLDASDAGKRLYGKLGFVEEDKVGLWQRESGSGLPTVPATRGATRVVTLAEENALRGRAAESLPAELLALDAAVWGDNRTKVLASYAKDDPSLFALARYADDRLAGWACAQKEAGILGPWLARDANSASSLLAWALGREESRVETVYIPAANAEGARLLTGAGFTRKRSLTHMRLGRALDPTRRRLVYSQANFALG